MSRDRKFSQAELTEILDAAMGKSLGEVDVNHVFDRTINNPKITGIAGDVVEQSVLGFDADNKAEPDIDVDGELIELKTTGIRKSKTDTTFLKQKNQCQLLVFLQIQLLQRLSTNLDSGTRLEKCY